MKKIDIEKLKQELANATTRNQILNIKARYIGKKSQLGAEFTKLKSLSSEQRIQLGKQLNQTRDLIEKLVGQALERIINKTDFTPIDITKPGVNLNSHPKIGSLHPSSLVLAETYQIFTELGFAIVDSAEIETDWYNFEALNMPPQHPAREMQDTFYIKGQDHTLLPRTHTSGMQVRFMEKNKPPFKIIVPGKVFRSENEDATHCWSFFQVEGLVVGEGVSMSDLKGTLLQIVQRQLGKDTKIRFRPSYFPYTEPSVETDAHYKGKWLEMGGAGMVHPDVLRRGGIDPEKYTGFAFGWGVERIAGIKYGLDDLRELWRPNLTYLEQF